MRMKYLGPDHVTAMKLRRVVVDLQAEKKKCRPFGPEFDRLEALLVQIDAVHQAFFGKPARETAGQHVCGVAQTVKSPPPG